MSLQFRGEFTTGPGEIVRRDRARAQKLLRGLNSCGPNAGKTPDSRDDANDVSSSAVTYTTSICIGKPPENYKLLIDTCGSNTWIGSTKYNATETNQSTKRSFNVSYTNGTASGSGCKLANPCLIKTHQAQFFSSAVLDKITFDNGLSIEGQPIGVADTVSGFENVDGVLGLGPLDWSTKTGTASSDSPSVVTNLFSKEIIGTELMALSFYPDDEGLRGEIDFEHDLSKQTGDAGFVPITSTQPASSYWGIDQSAHYGESNTPILDSSSGILDIHTRLIMIASDAFSAYQDATKSTLDETTGLLTIPESQLDELQSLFFTIGGVAYEVSADAQIWPRALNSKIGGKEGQIYLVVADMGSPSGNGLDFVNGVAFLQRFYTILDTTNVQVGLATGPLTYSSLN